MKKLLLAILAISPSTLLLLVLAVIAQQPVQSDEHCTPANARYRVDPPPVAVEPPPQCPIQSDVVAELPTTAAAPEKRELSLSIGCGFGEYPVMLDDYEIKEIRDFFDKAIDFDGQEVHVTLDISRTCSSCECKRHTSFENAKLPETIDDVSGLVIDGRPKPKNIVASPLEKNGHEIIVWGSHFLNTLYLYLPRYEDLPLNGRYRKAQYGSHLYVEGPFIPLFYGENGALIIYLEPSQH